MARAGLCFIAFLCMSSDLRSNAYEREQYRIVWDVNMT